MENLYLTSAERTIFDQLPESVREGWEPENEQDPSEELPAKRRMRLHLLKLRDPKLKKFVQEAQQKDSPDTLGELVQSSDLSGVADSDLAELFFALGPFTLSRLIEAMLKDAKSDTDLDDIGSLTIIRHSLLEAVTHHA